MLKNYIKIAFRNLLKQKLSSVINIGGLALGMATAVLLMLWVYNEFTYDQHHKKADRIYRVTSHLTINKGEVWHWAVTPMLLADKLTETFPEVEESTRLYTPWDETNIKIGENLLSVKELIYVDENWFDLFDYQVVNGGLASFKSDKNNIVVTESKAKEFFGESNPIDKIIQLDSLSLVVKAVVKDYPPNTSFKYNVFVQNAARLANPELFNDDNNWDNSNFQTFVLCHENTQISNLEKKITTTYRQLTEDNEATNELRLQSLLAIHYDNSIEIGETGSPVDKKVLLIFAGIAFLILLTACINYVNLTTANISLRNKEVSIKKFMGVSKGGLFSQFFVETAFTSLLSMFIAIGIIYVGLPSLESIVDNRFDIVSNPLVWQILGIATLVSILLNGIYPSVLLSNLKPLQLIKGSSVLGTKNATFRKALVVFQFTFTIALLICTFLIFSQLKFIQNKDLGYQKDQVFSFYIPWYADQSDQKTKAIFNQLQKESQIADITRSSGNIIDFNSTHSGSLDWEGREQDWNPTVSPMSVANNYRDFFDLKLKEGRWFLEENAADNNNVILNEAAVKEFRLKEPVVGQRFKYQGNEGQVIAVVENFHFQSPKVKITPLMFYRNTNRQAYVSVKANANDVAGAIEVAQKAWQVYVPDAPFKYQFLDDSYEEMHRSESKQLQLFYIFGGIVLLISCFGLFGLATFAAEVRIKEIGVRKVLGASVLEIVNLLSKDFLILIGIAALLASPIAWWFMKTWLSDFAYHIEMGWATFVIPALLVTLVTLLTVSYQSIRAALLNPIQSLKSE